MPDPCLTEDCPTCWTGTYFTGTYYSYCGVNKNLKSVGYNNAFLSCCVPNDEFLYLFSGPAFAG